MVESGHAVARKKPGEPLRGRCDSFVVETDVHYPTDVNLLWDAMRCLLRELGRAARKHKIRGWRQWRHLTEEVKKCFNKVRSTRRAKSQPDRVEAYIERCCRLVDRAEESCKELEQAGVAQSGMIQSLIAHARRSKEAGRRKSSGVFSKARRSRTTRRCFLFSRNTLAGSRRARLAVRWTISARSSRAERASAKSHRMRPTPRPVICPGFVEACAQRLKLRWRRAGGQAILTLRALQSSRFDQAWALLSAKTNSSSSFTTRFYGKGAIPILRCRSSTRRRHCIPTYGCAASTVGSTVPTTGCNSTKCSTSMRCRARVGFQWPSASASKRKHLPRPGASTRRSSRQSTTSSIAVSTGCAPTAPMGLHTPLHCRYWPPTCTASVCLCDGACVRLNDVEDAALPERGHLLRTSPPGPAHGEGNGLRCPEVENVDRFDAEHPSVVSVRPVAWPKPRRKCGGSSQISYRSGGFLADTSYCNTGGAATCMFR